MEEKQQNKTAQYALIQALYWMSFCMIFAYASVYLLDKGLSNSEIGLLIGVSGTISAVLQPWIGGIADSGKRMSLKGMILFIGGLMFAFGAALVLVGNHHVLTLFCYGAAVTFLQVLMPLIYSLGMGCINQGSCLNFGLARGIGSLAYAGISYGAGILVSTWGTGIIPVLITGLYALLLIAVSGFRYSKTRHPAAEAAAGEKEQNRGGGLTFFRRYPTFAVFLAGSVLVFVSHNMINNFLFQIMETKGGGSAAMGTAIALAAASELPTMFLFGWLVKKAGSDVWLKVSGVFFALKAVATVVVKNVAQMYLIQGLQMFGFALFVVASVYYVNSIMEERDRVKGQAYMTMTNTLGAVLGSACGGILIDAAGIHTMLLVSAASAAVGMVVMGVSSKKVPNK